MLHLPARKLAQLLANLGKNLIARMDERDGDILGAEILESLLADRAATTASVFRISCSFCICAVVDGNHETENSPSVLLLTDSYSLIFLLLLILRGRVGVRY